MRDILLSTRSGPLYEIGDDRLRQAAQRNDMSFSVFRPRRWNRPRRHLGFVEPLEFLEFRSRQLGDTDAGQENEPKRLSNALRVRRIADSTPKKAKLGIGKLIFMFGENGSYDYMFAAVMAIVVAACASDALLVALTNYLLRWQDTNR